MSQDKILAKIAELEQEQEKAKSAFYRLEGALAILREQLADSKDSDPKPEKSKSKG